MSLATELQGSVAAQQQQQLPGQIRPQLQQPLRQPAQQAQQKLQLQQQQQVPLPPATAAANGPGAGDGGGEGADADMDASTVAEREQAEADALEEQGADCREIATRAGADLSGFQDAVRGELGVIATLAACRRYLRASGFRVDRDGAIVRRRDAFLKIPSL